MSKTSDEFCVNNSSIEDINTWNLKPSFSDKILLIACRHYIKSTGNNEADFVKMLYNLSSQAQDEYMDTWSHLISDKQQSQLQAVN